MEKVLNDEEQGLDIEQLLEVKGVNAQGFGVIPKIAMRDKRLPCQSKAIYSYLCSFAGSGTTAFPGIVTMQKEIGLHENAFFKYRKVLITYGYIKIIKKRCGNKWHRVIYELCPNPTEVEHLQIEGVQIGGVQIGGIQIDGTNNNSLSSKKVSKEKDITSGVRAGARPKETKYPREGYQDIMDSNGVSDMVQYVLWEFIKHCQLNGAMLTNSKLLDIITRLDITYGKNEESKCRSLTAAINGGHVDIKENF